MPVAVEQVEVGDRAVLWFQGAALPEQVIVNRVVEGLALFTLHANRNGEPIEINVQRGHTVDLAC